MPDLSTSKPEPKRIRYVCIPGSPFTGSTLLGTLLNEHPSLASIGAAVGLLARADLATYRCSCGKLFRDCEFWTQVAAKTEELGHPVNVLQTDFWNTHLRLSANRIINALLVRSLKWDAANTARDAIVLRSAKARRAISEMGWNSWSLAAAILEITGKEVFIDTSRDHQRPKYLAMHPRLDIKVIHLVRDPRGNSASIMKHTGANAARAARQWKHYNVEAARVRRYLPAESWLSLKYEDLCADPAGVLDRISEFVGVRRAAVLDGPREVHSHIIGNKRRLEGRPQVREDRSWQTTLTETDLGRIARIAGTTSHDMGFNWP